MFKKKIIILIAILFLLFLTGCRCSGFSIGAIKVDSPYGDSYAPIVLVNIEFGEK